MTYSEVEAFLSRLSYKPGYRISLAPRSILGDQHYAFISLSTPPVPDATGKSSEMHAVHKSISLNLSVCTEERLLACLKIGWREHEIHEYKEWFKLDGRCVDDPHPELSGSASGPRPQA